MFGALMARWLIVCALVALGAPAGCCVLGPHGACHSCGPQGCGPDPCSTCCFRWPKPIMWCGDCNECGPEGQGCACPADCGLMPALMRDKTCGKGCGEVYWGEWYSDPPDCCDPCDQCYGQWTGPHGHCRLGPMQHLLAALHGFKYCPRPCCDEGCGGFCTKGSCNACGGASAAGGCATCGHGQPAGSHPGVMTGQPYYEHAPHGGESILHENWDRPAGPKPVPGKPLHKAQQPTPGRVTQSVAPGTNRVQTAAHQEPTASPGTTAPPVYGRMVKTASYWGR